MTALLSVRNLGVTAGSPRQRVPILHDVSFDVPAASTVALVGESGSGKSTLCSAILGLMPPGLRRDAGQILFADDRAGGGVVDLTSLAPDRFRALRGNRIAMAFQEPSAAFSPVITIGDLLREMLQAHDGGASRADHDRRIHEILTLTGFPDPAAAAHRYPFELSGGLRQRAMLASALVCRPALVIADEPTSALDVTVQALTLKLLADLQDQLGLSLLLVTHDFGVVANVADHVVVLKDGTVSEAGPAAQVLRAPQSAHTKALLDNVPRLHGRRLDFGDMQQGQPTAHALTDVWRNRIGPQAGTRLIEARGVSKRFTARKPSDGERSVDAVLGASLTITSGACVGLVGESGCGKSTLSRMILRALTPDEGRIMAFDGQAMQDVAQLSGAALKLYRSRVQYVFQDPFSALNPRFTAEDIVTEPYVIHGLGDRAQRARWAVALMEMTGLSPATLARHPHAFSGGQRQRLCIARALALGPDVLVCDEPVSALDVSVQAQILGLLDGLRRDLNLAMLFVSHNLAVVRAVASHVHVMCAGRIVEAGPTETLFEQPGHPYTAALLAAHPEPDADRKLDLSALMDGRASDPTAWPAPYRLLPGEIPTYKAVGDGHVVAVGQSQG